MTYPINTPVHPALSLHLITPPFQRSPFSAHKWKNADSSARARAGTRSNPRARARATAIEYRVTEQAIGDQQRERSGIHRARHRQCRTRGGSRDRGRGSGSRESTTGIARRSERPEAADSFIDRDGPGVRGKGRASHHRDSRESCLCPPRHRSVRAASLARYDTRYTMHNTPTPTHPHNLSVNAHTLFQCTHTISFKVHALNINSSV